MPFLRVTVCGKEMLDFPEFVQLQTPDKAVLIQMINAGYLSVGASRWLMSF
jgi:hypothetical protein